MTNPKLKPHSDLKVALRKYTDKDGKERTAWLKIGTLFASPHMNHLFISLEALPIGIEWSGAVSVFKREEFDGNPISKDEGTQEIEF